MTIHRTPFDERSFQCLWYTTKFPQGTTKSQERHNLKYPKFQARGGDAARGAVIAELVKYLKDFMNDAEAWMELCELYILEQDYAKAAFCCEELILQNPHNHIYYQRCS